MYYASELDLSSSVTWVTCVTIYISRHCLYYILYKIRESGLNRNDCVVETIKNCQKQDKKKKEKQSRNGLKVRWKLNMCVNGQIYAVVIKTNYYYYIRKNLIC